MKTAAQKGLRGLAESALTRIQMAGLRQYNCWYAHGESNPGPRAENPVS